MNETPSMDELFRFGEIAFDAATIFGSTSDQSMKRVRRCLNRAAIDLAGNKNRRWSWLQRVYHFKTVENRREYSLPQSVKTIHQIWISDLSRQKIDRIPTGKFVELVPNPELSKGVPRLYDYEGVDSNGAIVASFYPIPSGIYKLNVRHTAQIVPIRDDEADVRAAWGMPANLLTALTQKAAAYACQGVSNAKFMELNQSADMLIEIAYDDDQANPGTTFRAPMQDEWDMTSDGPMLPAQYGNS